MWAAWHEACVLARRCPPLRANVSHQHNRGHSIPQQPAAAGPHLYVGQAGQDLHALLRRGGTRLSLGGKQLAVLAHSLGVPPRPCICVRQPQLVLLVRGILFRQQCQLGEGDGWAGRACWLLACNGIGRGTAA